MAAKDINVWFESLTSEHRAMVLKYPERFRDLANELAAFEGSIFAHTLDFTAGADDIVDRLVVDGGPWGYRNPAITSANFPVKGAGLVVVRYAIIPGVKIERANDGHFFAPEADAALRKARMRRPNPAEALLVPAKNPKIGRGEHPLVMFLEGSAGAFCVGGGDRERDLYLRHFSGGGTCNTDCDVLGVCE